MNDHGLTLPLRNEKPRDCGITILIDNGIPLNFFKDTMNSAAPYIDFVKFGWGTSVVSRHLEEKIDHLRQNGIAFFFGGTLFEKFASQGKTDRYVQYCRRFACEYVEISNGTLPLSNPEKCHYIAEFSKEFKVLSEVGSKDTAKSIADTPALWLESISQDLEAGAYKVMTEARESGTSGICNGDGEIREEMFAAILDSGIPRDAFIFEAPNKQLQAFFIQQLGPDANLANIPFSDALALETLRLGLRSDTFFIGGDSHEKNG